MLAAAKGPCISIFLPLPELLEVRTRLKNAIRNIEKRLGGEHRALLESVSALADDTSAEGRWSTGLVVFRSPDLFRHFWVREFSRELVSVEDRFQIRPFLALLRTDKRFYILALSQKQVRLLRCTDGECREASLPPSVPKSLQEASQTTRPDHALDNRSGSMKGVVFGMSSDRDAKGEYLLHFFKDIDKAVQTILKNETAPLVLAGVEPEVALYRRVNSYPHLMERAIPAAFGGVKPGELYARAQEIVREHSIGPLQKALAQFERLRNAGRVLFEVKAILNDAQDGRIAQLFLREDAEARGDDGADLLNQAALETLVHGGQVFVLKPEQSPDKAPAVAVLRY
jgi:hypothetical protein